VLRRRIMVFRQADGGWRRSDKLHMLRLYPRQEVLDDLYPRQEVLDDLVSAGFQPRVLAGYGSAARFRRGHAGILAVKPSKGTS
jgi:microcompartment protein CcmK/EutM